MMSLVTAHFVITHGTPCLSVSAVARLDECHHARQHERGQHETDDEALHLPRTKRHLFFSNFRCGQFFVAAYPLRIAVGYDRVALPTPGTEMPRKPMRIRMSRARDASTIRATQFSTGHPSVLTVHLEPPASCLDGVAIRRPPPP